MTARRSRPATPKGPFLLDVNVLVALAWPTHVHHGPARHWFAGHHGEGWATTPVTEFGFVRVSSNAAAVGAALTPAEALTVLAQIRARPGHRSWADDLSPTDARYVDPVRLVGHRQVTDAHLLALARRHDGRLATLDRGVADLAGGDAPTRVALIPVP
ncbi:MAG TPA: TA system VapC family ribonuclease toxin [Acidimicrobiia bacterium]|nr:TA system VapC family ribonuclease toxin [Acidimicrobiia bacterium]